MNDRRAIRHFFFTLLVQLIVFGALPTLSRALHALEVPPWSAVIVIPSVLGGAAYFAATFLSMTVPWRILNAILPAGVTLSIFGTLAAAPLAALAVFSVLLFLPTVWTRVPYYPTNHAVQAELLKLLPLDTPFSFVDLGCGFGGVLTGLAAARPLGRFHGVELSPLAYAVSAGRAFLARNRNVRVGFRSLWRVELGEFDYVYCFLAPPPMAELWKKASREMLRNSVFVTNTFAVPAPAERVVRIEGPRQTVLYVHSISGDSKGVIERRENGGSS